MKKRTLKKALLLSRVAIAAATLASMTLDAAAKAPAASTAYGDDKLAAEVSCADEELTMTLGTLGAPDPRFEYIIVLDPCVVAPIWCCRVFPERCRPGA